MNSLVDPWEVKKQRPQPLFCHSAAALLQLAAHPPTGTCLLRKKASKLYSGKRLSSTTRVATRRFPK